MKKCRHLNATLNIPKEYKGCPYCQIDRMAKSLKRKDSLLNKKRKEIKKLLTTREELRKEVLRLTRIEQNR
jgi:hypothetical protein